MLIEVMFFEGCPNHPPALRLVRDAAAELGVAAEFREVRVNDQADAERLGFPGSPTIRVDGLDVEPAARSGREASFACRTYDGRGLPGREVVVAALREAVAGCCAPSAAAPAARPERAGVLAAGGSVVTAALASACCWVPLLLLGLGVSAGGAAAWLERYRLPLLGITLLLLAAGFYLVYFRQPACTPGSTCAAPRPKLRRASRAMLWTATVFVATFALFPSWVGALMGAAPPSAGAGDGAEGVPIRLRIDGMTCEACAAVVREALVRVPGVRRADVSYGKSEAVAIVDADRAPSAGALADAVRAAGYGAGPS